MEVADIGVQKRTAVKMASKKRKVAGVEPELFSKSLTQLKTRCIPAEKSVSPENSGNSTCASFNSSSRVSASCCSSDELSDLDKDNLNVLDLKEENEMVSEEFAIETSTADSVNFRQRRETKLMGEVENESVELESTMKAEKMPSQAELEEFFAAAEKDLQKKFADKYNYDIVKDKPLEGRYDWVRIHN